MKFDVLQNLYKLNISISITKMTESGGSSENFKLPFSPGPTRTSTLIFHYTDPGALGDGK